MDRTDAMVDLTCPKVAQCSPEHNRVAQGNFVHVVRVAHVQTCRRLRAQAVSHIEIPHSTSKGNGTDAWQAKAALKPRFSI